MVPYLWGSKPPDNTKNSIATENCAQIAATKSFTYINDAFCSSRIAFICQSDPCDAFFPGSLYGYGKCYKYYNSAVSWQSAQEYCLSLNSHLAEPETSQVQELLNVYLYNTTAWIGGITINCSKSFQWYVSGNLVSGNFSRFVEGSCLNNSLLMSNVANISSLKARDGQETHGFVCQKAIIATDQQVYVAVFPRLLKTSLQGLLQLTSNFNDVVYVRFKVNSDGTSDALTINPLTPGTAVNFYVENNIILGSTGIYTRYVEVNSSQPVTVVLYIMDQSTISSTLLYPIQIKISDNLIPSINSISDCNINVHIVDNMTAVLESLYQTLNINLQTNLDGTYLYSTEPVILTLGGTGQIPMAADTTLDDVLPMAYIGSDYVSFPFRIPDSETHVKLLAFNNWTLITALCSNRTILLDYVGDTYSFLLDTACYIRGNRSLYVYQILSKPTYSHQELCVTSLLASSHWRYEYNFAKVSDIYTVNIYIIAGVNSSSDIMTNDMSVQWTCQNITGTNLLGCDTTLLSHVTYLHIQLANTQSRFGAYVIGHESTSSFCHPMGIKDAAQPSNLELGFCSKNFYNGKLAEPITQNELNAIYKLVDVVRNGALNFITWIGANDVEVEGHFVWASDNSTLNPALWGKSAPDNWLNPYTNERENCVSLFLNENSTRLNDASCSLNYSLICQSDPCDTYLPGSLFSDGKCYKYYNYDLTWEKAQPGLVAEIKIVVQLLNGLSVKA
uniref:C-type lectin domain-containing protein n=1 Tax=Biomphalaria glabrata TaxID=6526 RepID=A0A2C9LW25_BIOGL